MKRTIKLTIEFDGTNFKGWQSQKKGVRTVQTELNTSIQKVFKNPTKIFGSGRTDSGVHAKGQIAHFKTNTDLDEKTIIKAINATTPDDISIHQCAFVTDDFHSQYDAKSKTYVYTIDNNSTPRPLLRKYSYFFPQKINLSKMKREAQTLCGRHDFTSFRASDPDDKRKTRKSDNIRTINIITIKKKSGLIHIEITGNGFLYKMVRNIVGTLLMISTSNSKTNLSMQDILKAKNRNAAGNTAPAQGLLLLNVKYKS